MKLNTGTSVVDNLKSKGLPSDFASRAKLAARKGITNYTGSAAQNTKLLGLVKQGAGSSLKAGTGGSKPAASAAPKAAAPRSSGKPAAPAAKAAPAAPKAPATKSPPVAASDGTAKTVPATTKTPASKPAISNILTKPATGTTTSQPKVGPAKPAAAKPATSGYSRPAVTSSDGLLYKSGILKKPLQPTDAKKAELAKSPGSAYGKGTDLALLAAGGAGAGKLAGMAGKAVGSVVARFAKKPGIRTAIPTGKGTPVQSATRPSAVRAAAPKKALPASGTRKVTVTQLPKGQALPSTARKALPSSTKASPFASGKPSAPTSPSTTVRTGQGSSVQSAPRPSRGLPAPKKALPAPKPAAKKAAPKKAAPKKAAAK